MKSIIHEDSVQCSVHYSHDSTRFARFWIAVGSVGSCVLEWLQTQWQWRIAVSLLAVNRLSWLMKTQLERGFTGMAEPASRVLYAVSPGAFRIQSSNGNYGNAPRLFDFLDLEFIRIIHPQVIFHQREYKLLWQ